MHATAKGEIDVTVSFCSIFSKFDETFLNVQLLLISMKIGDQKEYSTLERAFPDILEDVGSKDVSGGKPLDPHLHFLKLFADYSSK